MQSAPPTGAMSASTAPPPSSGAEEKPKAGAAAGYFTDSLGFMAMDSNVPGLSSVILQKLNMKSLEEYRSAVEGNSLATNFGIRTYMEMFQKMEDTYKFCVQCKKIPSLLPEQRGMRRCKSSECSRENWPIHKKFCRKLKLAAIDRLVEWLIFTGDIPFPTAPWTKTISNIKSWDDWFSMQENLEVKLDQIMAGRYMGILWSNCGKPKPENPEIRESIKRLTTDFFTRPVTIGFAINAFRADPFSAPITVHVVGASHIETLNIRATDYDELAKMFPGNQGLEVVMVGPEVVNGPVMRPPLTAFGPRGKVYLSGYKALYHIFWETLVESQRAARPDLVVGFHPGFHASQGLTEGWLPTLLLLRDYDIPCLFTVYSEQELKYSLQILAELETKVIGSGPFPFASQKPEQVQSDPNKPPVSSNAYFLLFKGATWQDAETDMGELDLEDHA
ncbi:putative protein MSS51 homolog, mitochondrial isoform X2 [Hyperolius riggenbachi]|uniref:putative protein MSS51 homolog, mitochondrial isoform X2 n=1 Tax=Hyperolius riggenbachi TaxID=752182 RepID=UPI0035A30516